MSNAFMDAGWEIAETLLKGEGRRTIFSPWVTESQLLLQGDRLLIRGELHDFATGSSSINVIEELLSKNVEVRVCTNLHAKVYVLETKEECLGWLGSANFTKRGKKSLNGNIEAMSGVFTLDELFMNMIETVWGNSKPIDLNQIKPEISALREIYQLLTPFIDINSSIEKQVLAVKIKFRSGLGRLTLRDKWLNIKRNKDWDGVTFPTVPFLKPELSANYDSTKDAFIKNIEDVGAKSIGEGVYLFRASLKSSIERILSKACITLSQFDYDAISDLRSDFQSRFEVVLSKFAGEKKLAIDDLDMQNAVQDAMSEFDNYVSKKIFTMNYSYFLPLAGGFDAEIEGLILELQNSPLQHQLFNV